jgi:pectin methylesterase-like acyl-CoA thioesterase
MTTTIQAAIDAAEDGDVIVVRPGNYNEKINFNGKNITLRSTDPDDPEVVARRLSMPAALDLWLHSAAVKVKAL